MNIKRPKDALSKVLRANAKLMRQMRLAEADTKRKEKQQEERVETLRYLVDTLTHELGNLEMRYAAAKDLTVCLERELADVKELVDVGDRSSEDES